MTICLLLSFQGENGGGEPNISKLISPYSLLGVRSPAAISGGYHHENMRRLEYLVKNALGPTGMAEIQPVRLEIEVEGVHVGRMNIEDLPGVQVLNVSRLKSDLKEQLTAAWASIGGEPDFLEKGTKKPHLIDVLHYLPAFSHLKMIIYPFAADNCIISMATYFGPKSQVAVKKHI